MLQLEYFLAVSRMGNMTSAAASLNVAQSSVSRSIARLEETLGVPLFERSGRGIVLNDYGKLFYTRAETIMREVADGERQLKELRDSHIGRVSISTASARSINPLMVQYISEHRDVLFRQRRLTDLHLVKKCLDNGELDYALTYSPLADLEYEWTPVITEYYYLMVPANHPLSGRTSLTLTDLDGIPLLLNSCDDPGFLEARCRQVEAVPQLSFISDEYELLGPMVEQDLGCAIISTLSLYDMRKSLPIHHFSKIQVIRIADDGLKRTLGILSRKHHYLSSAARAFYKKLISYFKTVELEISDTDQ